MKNKMKNKKKGFTLLELVIVIAVFAVLMAVLIPTFVGIIRRAKLTADQTMVKNLNTLAFENEKSHGKATTIREAIAVAKENNFNVEALTPTADGAYILWDSVNDRWILFDAKENTIVYNDKNFEVPANVYLWNIHTTYIEEDGYSVYLKDGYNGETTLNITTGLDVGNNTNITAINYDRHNATTAQTVIIQTNSAGTNLTVNAPKDTVNHYGAVGIVNVTAIDMNCYNELGEAANVKVTEGKVVAKNGGKIDVVFANNTDGSKVAVVKETSGEIVEGYTTVETVHTSNLARNGGIALTYNKTETEITEIAETAVDKAQEKEVVANQKENDVLYQARIGTKGFETIKDAIETALDGDKIVLMSDLTRGINHTSSANKFAATRNPGYPITYKDAVITIDFNGHSINDGGVCCFPTPNSNQTIIYKNSGESESVYEHESSTTPIGNGGNSIVNGGTFIAHRENNMDTLIGCSNGCSTIINNGTFRAPLVEPVNTYPGQSYNQYSAVAVIRIGYGEITINGGDFTGNIVKGKFGDGVLTINGGTFHNFRVIATPGDGNSQQTISITGGIFDADPTDYLDDGYIATNNGDGTWTVTANN